MALSTDRPLTAAQRLGIAMREARLARHMETRELAHSIGISESACRRLENGETRNCRGETFLAVIVWAGSRGMREFGDWRITPQGSGHRSTVQFEKAAAQ